MFKNPEKKPTNLSEMFYLLFLFCKMLFPHHHVVTKVSMKQTKMHLPAAVSRELTKEVSRYSFESYIIYMEVSSRRVATLL